MRTLVLCNIQLTHNKYNMIVKKMRRYISVAPLIRNFNELFIFYLIYLYFAATATAFTLIHMHAEVAVI